MKRVWIATVVILVSVCYATSTNSSTSREVLVLQKRTTPRRPVGPVRRVHNISHVLVGGVGGEMSLLDSRSGRIEWVIDTGGDAVSAHGQVASSVLAVPSTDGSLYLLSHSPQQPTPLLQRSGLTVAELALKCPLIRPSSDASSPMSSSSSARSGEYFDEYKDTSNTWLTRGGIGGGEEMILSEAVSSGFVVEFARGTIVSQYRGMDTKMWSNPTDKKCDPDEKPFDNSNSNNNNNNNNRNSTSSGDGKNKKNINSMPPLVITREQFGVRGVRMGGGGTVWNVSLSQFSASFLTPSGAESLRHVADAEGGEGSFLCSNHSLFYVEHGNIVWSQQLPSAPMSVISVDEKRFTTRRHPVLPYAENFRQQQQPPKSTDSSSSNNNDNDRQEDEIPHELPPQATLGADAGIERGVLSVHKGALYVRPDNVAFPVLSPQAHSSMSQALQVVQSERRRRKCEAAILSKSLSLPYCFVGGHQIAGDGKSRALDVFGRVNQNDLPTSSSPSSSTASPSSSSSSSNPASSFDLPPPFFPHNLKRAPQFGDGVLAWVASFVTEPLELLGLHSSDDEFNDSRFLSDSGRDGGQSSKSWWRRHGKIMFSVVLSMAAGATISAAWRMWHKGVDRSLKNRKATMDVNGNSNSFSISSSILDGRESSKGDDQDTMGGLFGRRRGKIPIFNPHPSVGPRRPVEHHEVQHGSSSMMSDLTEDPTRPMLKSSSSSSSLSAGATPTIITTGGTQDENPTALLLTTGSPPPRSASSEVATEEQAQQQQQQQHLDLHSSSSPLDEKLSAPTANNNEDEDSDGAGDASGKMEKASRARKRRERRNAKEKWKESQEKKTTSTAAADESATSKTDDKQIETIGNIEVFRHEELGVGSSGTVVYAGRLDGVRPIAVKRVLLTSKQTERELIHHAAGDGHPNIVRIFCAHRDTNFLYIALERCDATLAQIVDEFGFPLINPPADQRAVTVSFLRSLRSLLQGVAHLHSLQIVHCDINPWNILAVRSNPFQLKICDLGLSARPRSHSASFETPLATRGWKAAETLQGGRGTKSVDVFSCGCVIYYCLTRAEHPFGNPFDVEANILQGKSDLKHVDRAPEARDLVSRMIDANPLSRPSAISAQIHPLFWSNLRKLDFLCVVSDLMESDADAASGILIKAVEGAAADIFSGTDWSQCLCSSLIEGLSGHRKYNTSSSKDLLRLLRNKRNHFSDLNSELRMSLHDDPANLMEYFGERFPCLFIEIFRIVHSVSQLASHPRLVKFLQSFDL